MEKKELRIVYMGTPDFAVESLRALVEGGYNVVGVITMPDKPVGRHGSVLQASPVKEYALSQNLPVLQPEKLKDEAFLDALRALKADLQIVVAFRMLPEVRTRCFDDHRCRPGNRNSRSAAGRESRCRSPGRVL